jgi:hypothetical protein
MKYQLGNIVDVLLRNPSREHPSIPYNKPHYIKRISIERISVQDTDPFNLTKTPSVTSSLPAKDIIGLLLTKDWLLSFDFKFTEEGEHVHEDIWQKEDFRIWQHSEGFCFELNDEAPLKYVHQLQNLYFAHTGERVNKKLSINENDQH